MKYLLSLLALVMLMSTVAIAQPRRPDPINKRDAIKRRIRDLRAYTLIDKLQLDPATQTRLWPVLDKYDDETDKLVQQRVEVFRRLAASGGMAPREVDRAIDDAVATQKAFRDLEDHRLAELRHILTPKQVAKLLIVLPEFERRIQNQLRKAIVGANKRAQGAAAADDDDLELDEGPAKKPAAKPCDPYSAQGCR
jgi:Spy/CpxP family protein refolding chaperone